MKSRRERVQWDFLNSSKSISSLKSRKTIPLSAALLPSFNQLCESTWELRIFSEIRLRHFFPYDITSHAVHHGIHGNVAPRMNFVRERHYFSNRWWDWVQYLHVLRRISLDRIGIDWVSTVKAAVRDSLNTGAWTEFYARVWWQNKQGNDNREADLIQSIRWLLQDESANLARASCSASYVRLMSVSSIAG